MIFNSKLVSKINHVQNEAAISAKPHLSSSMKHRYQKHLIASLSLSPPTLSILSFKTKMYVASICVPELE